MELRSLCYLLDESEGVFINNNASVQNKLSGTCKTYKFKSQCFKHKKALLSPNHSLFPLPIAGSWTSYCGIAQDSILGTLQTDFTLPFVLSNVCNLVTDSQTHMCLPL